jgi:ketosteroid isomerase-like protein
MSNSAAIEDMLAKEAIRNLVGQYCRAVDRNDLDLLRSLYWEDALDEHGYNKSNTAKEFIDRIPEFTGINFIQHNVTSQVIVVNGDEAEGESYVLAYHNYMTENGPAVMMIGGRYLDRYLRKDGEWRIQHRKCTTDWGHEFPVPSLNPPVGFVDGVIAAGTKSGDDVSYEFFKLFKRGQRVT